MAVYTAYAFTTLDSLLVACPETAEQHRCTRTSANALSLRRRPQYYQLVASMKRGAEKQLTQDDSDSDAEDERFTTTSGSDLGRDLQQFDAFSESPFAKSVVFPGFGSASSHTPFTFTPSLTPVAGDQSNKSFQSRNVSTEITSASPSLPTSPSAHYMSASTSLKPKDTNTPTHEALSDVNADPLTYYVSLRGLNISFMKAISDAVESDPFVDIAQVLEQYTEHRACIERAYNSNNSAESSSHSSTRLESAALRTPSSTPLSTPNFARIPSVSKGKSRETGSPVNSPLMVSRTPTLLKTALACGIIPPDTPASASLLGHGSVCGAPINGVGFGLPGTTNSLDMGMIGGSPMSLGVGLVPDPNIDASSIPSTGIHSAPFDETSLQDLHKIERRVQDEGLSQGIAFTAENTDSGATEETMYTSKAKVYKLDKNDALGGTPGWTAVGGVGTLQYKKHKATGASRMLVTESSNNTIVLNVSINNPPQPRLSFSEQAITLLHHGESKESTIYKIHVFSKESVLEFKRALE
ncbi:hypothetical protein BV25DRAFT_1920115 [Artomyces pyxidatus]|uniref:Uncharacterized protein n=1 Tax=Artomyces pyxidatus TaxID=48021 RepID=A0ACB8SM84_9AGAM|nr:hypothetical protein BV25DRAFT_1920115 [Artomyces pyxidatus]